MRTLPIGITLLAAALLSGCDVGGSGPTVAPLSADAAATDAADKAKASKLKSPESAPITKVQPE